MVTGAAEGGLLGQHMNHRIAEGFALSRRSAITRSALAGQLRLAAGQRPGGICATLLYGARIVLTHRVRQRIEPLVQCRRVGVEDTGPDPSHPRSGLPDVHIPVVFDLARDPHAGRIKLGHP